MRKCLALWGPKLGATRQVTGFSITETNLSIRHAGAKALGYVETQVRMLALQAECPLFWIPSVGHVRRRRSKLHVVFLMASSLASTRATSASRDLSGAALAWVELESYCFCRHFISLRFYSK
jgi:hypothetical protein